MNDSDSGSDIDSDIDVDLAAYRVYSPGHRTCPVRRPGSAAGLGLPWIGHSPFHRSETAREQLGFGGTVDDILYI